MALRTRASHYLSIMDVSSLFNKEGFVSKIIRGSVLLLLFYCSFLIFVSSANIFSSFFLKSTLMACSLDSTAFLSFRKFSRSFRYFSLSHQLLTLWSWNHVECLCCSQWAQLFQLWGDWSYLSGSLLVWYICFSKAPAYWFVSTNKSFSPFLAFSGRKECSLYCYSLSTSDEVLQDVRCCTLRIFWSFQPQCNGARNSD